MIGDIVTAPSRDRYRGMIVALGNLLQHDEVRAGQFRVYWGRNDSLTWENPDELEVHRPARGSR